ncbi:toprim domain-containing protein [bacterium]|jgi:DNA topoisomerase-2|nr:toprim domain-containing protein [bacterium]
MINRTIEERYKKLSQREHVLEKSGMYIGNITTELKDMFVVENTNDFDNIKIINKLVKYNAGFLKIFDEILSNASDHSIRTGGVKYIKVNVFNDHVVIENDGPGIPIVIHKEHGIYIPEMLFGNLLTGENYQKDDDRLVAGTNGIGSKATNIFSKRFLVETADGKKQYNQEFSNNLINVGKPKITKSNKNYTKVKYYPDFEKFGLEYIDDDIQKLFIKRVIDIATYCPTLKVYYNDTLIKIKSFKDYMSYFVEKDTEMFYEKLNDNWEIGIVPSTNDNFQQSSLVNGTNCYIGGTHVNFITNKLVSQITDSLSKKNKKISIKPNDIKNKLFVFVNCKIVNPVFDSQTKENLSTKITNAISCNAEISDKLIKQISQSSIVEDILNYIELREKAELKKLGKGKTSKVKIKKLDDANMAGTRNSDKCILFLAEGDSASGTILTGFASTGRDYYGCFPLKGKPLNVKSTTLSKIKENDEIKNIITALGLEFGKKYINTTELRYGKIVFATDADNDGMHIKGLLINLFETFWPELLKLDFIYDFVTPIMKIEKGKNVKFFYKLDEYKKWKDLNEKGWNQTYYKGLGTIESHEIKDFFKNIQKHLIRFNYTDIDETKECIDLVFNDKRSDDRKEWLLNYIPGIEVDKFANKTTYKSFFDEEFIQFSMADNIRSIPSIVDGFKPSQRKIMYTMFKNNYKEKVKVGNFSGAVIEKSSYHHGNQSIEGAVINLAQDFINTNNINLLEPLGNYGSRLKGGKDAASSRYIFTKLSPITRHIFKEVDDNILDYLDDDGFLIEPRFYTPIIPMCLINGAEGIGTGWSTFIPKYNPKDIVKYLVNKLQDKKSKIDIIPYYKNFTGEIKFDSDKNRYVTSGIIKKINMSTLKISELPIGTWNDSYYNELDKLVDKNIIKDYSKNDTDIKVDITINISREMLKDLEDKDEDLIKLFSLESYLSISNFMMWDINGKIKKYSNIYDIMDEFYDIRLKYYDKRKIYILEKLDKEINIILNRMKFINAILKGNLIINNVKREKIELSLVEMQLDKVDDSYNYLLNMPLVSLTNEKLHELKESHTKKKDEKKIVESISINQMWLDDLKSLVPFIK